MKDIEKLARKRVKKKKSFYQHLGSYMSVGLFFFLLNVVTSFGDWWFFYPMLPWSIGLMIHYFSVFGIPGIGNYNEIDWEERAVEEEMRRINPDLPRQEKPEDASPLELKELERSANPRKPWDESELV